MRNLICWEQILLLRHLCESVCIDHTLLRHHRRRVHRQAVVEGANLLLGLGLVLTIGAHVFRVDRVLLLGGIIETDVHAWVDGSCEQSAVVVGSAHLTAESSVGYRGGGSSGLVCRAFSCSDRLYVTEREEILMFPLVDAHV